MKIRMVLSATFVFLAIGQLAWGVNVHQKFRRYNHEWEESHAAWVQANARGDFQGMQLAKEKQEMWYRAEEMAHSDMSTLWMFGRWNADYARESESEREGRPSVNP